MPDKFLPRCVAVETKSFVQASRLPSGSNPRGELPDSSPKGACQLGIINDHAVIIASLGLNFVTARSCDSGLFKALSFCSPDKRITFRGSEESFDRENHRSK